MRRIVDFAREAGPSLVGISQSPLYNSTGASRLCKLAPMRRAACAASATLLLLAPLSGSGAEIKISSDEPLSFGGKYGRLREHVIQIDSDGNFVAESTNPVQELFSALRIQKKRRIVLYVHGGRVPLASSRKRAGQLNVAIQDSDKDAYPIFLNWETGQFNSYFRHLAYERNGVSYRGSPAAPGAALASPLVLAADIGRGVARLPINTVTSLGKLLQNSDLLLGNTKSFPVKAKFDSQLAVFAPRGESVNQAYKMGFTYHPDAESRIPLHLALGRDAQHWRAGFFVKQLLTLPLQFTTEPIVDTIGTPAWSNMVRRTRSMFHPSTNYVFQHKGEAEPRGAAAEFFDALNQFVADEPQFQLDIFAHSMGAIVINEAFAQCPSMRVRHLVYMAAACGIRDFERTAGRHIEQFSTDFYNLSLHPRAELDDVEAFGIPIRGSLLVWIDEFFQSPESFGDRTLGTFENVLIARDFLPRTQKVHLKAFGMQEGPCREGWMCAGPQRHGEFDQYYSWTPEFRDTDYKKALPYQRINFLKVVRR